MGRLKKNSRTKSKQKETLNYIASYEGTETNPSTSSSESLEEENSNVWNEVLLRLRDYWTKSSSPIQSSSSFCSNHSAVSENCDRQDIVKFVKDALDYGLVKGVLVRRGKFYAFEDEVKSQDAVKLNASLSKDNKVRNSNILDKVSKSSVYLRPKPISIKKAKTLKIDKFFNSTKQIGNNLTARCSEKSTKTIKHRCARCGVPCAKKRNTKSNQIK